MRLDVRWPIGGMFSLIGLLLTVYGMVSDPALYERSLGINVNLWWGLALLLFGLVMLLLAYRAQRAAKPNATDSTSTP
jgi:protein-S-isoprenylcysteine O-methyltransferase Ste14